MHQPCCREESLKGLSTDSLTLSTAKKKKKKTCKGHIDYIGKKSNARAFAIGGSCKNFFQCQRQWRAPLLVLPSTLITQAGT